nr:ABC transporter ATP-binding protein [Corynebacterium uropygiale]
MWEGVSLRVDAGERVCLTGPSGCGKSTLLNCVGLLDTLDGGSLSLLGADLTRASARARMRVRRHDIGYLFQDYALIDNDTVEENVALACARGGVGRNRRRIDEALEIVGLGGRQKDVVYQLSGGEQQRVAVARVLVRRPSIILADEPTASLDRENAALVLDQLARCAEQGAAVLMVSHDPWAADHCDRKVAISQ